MNVTAWTRKNGTKQQQSIFSKMWRFLQIAFDPEFTVFFQRDPAFDFFNKFIVLFSYVRVEVIPPKIVI
ncbi:hypothetical protein AYB33_14285 [Leptospira santarosai]|nr:hypothetical protein AYB33_14285 [Leptospira santarosai]